MKSKQSQIMIAIFPAELKSWVSWTQNLQRYCYTYMLGDFTERLRKQNDFHIKN
jgi:hypothetical protein